jgi:hypothetical protein
MKNSNLAYVGSVSTVQSEKKISKLETINPVKTGVSFTEKQSELYSRLLIGLKFYSKEDLYTMNSTKKSRIKRNNIRAQKELNLWKQELSIAQSNHFLSEFFEKDSTFMQTMSTFDETSTKFYSKLSFKDLGINKGDVANMFISKGILPKNFWEL